MCCGPQCAGNCVCIDPAAARAIISAGAGRIANSGPSSMVPADVAGAIDHTLLRANATKGEVIALCAEAREHNFASVCVNPVWVKTAAQELRGTRVKVCTVVGFPLGAAATESKAMEAALAVAQGAAEVDMVIDVAAVKEGNGDRVKDDIAAVVEASGDAAVKVILETCLLDDDEKRRACEWSVEAGAAFVKTSTGFSGGGATVEDVALMRDVVGDALGVKASGGVRTIEDANKVIAAGANRIGASSSVAIVQCKTGGKGY